VTLLLTSLGMRTPLKVDVIRDRGSMGREVENDMIENVYRLQIINADEATHRYRISVSGIDGIVLATADQVTLTATETRQIPVRVRTPHGAGRSGSNRIVFEVQAIDGGTSRVREKAAFFIPRG
jgi:polyferredoxin